MALRDVPLDIPVELLVDGDVCAPTVTAVPSDRATTIALTCQLRMRPPAWLKHIDRCAPRSCNARLRRTTRASRVPIDASERCGPRSRDAAHALVRRCPTWGP